MLYAKPSCPMTCRCPGPHNACELLCNQQTTSLYECVWRRAGASTSRGPRSTLHFPRTHRWKNRATYSHPLCQCKRTPRERVHKNITQEKIGKSLCVCDCTGKDQQDSGIHQRFCPGRCDVCLTIICTVALSKVRHPVANTCMASRGCDQPCALSTEREARYFATGHLSCSGNKYVLFCSSKHGIASTHLAATIAVVALGQGAYGTA